MEHVSGLRFSNYAGVPENGKLKISDKEKELEKKSSTMKISTKAEGSAFYDSKTDVYYMDESGKVIGQVSKLYLNDKVMCTSLHQGEGHYPDETGNDSNSGMDNVLPGSIHYFDKDGNDTVDEKIANYSAMSPEEIDSNLLEEHQVIVKQREHVFRNISSFLGL